MNKDGFISLNIVYGKSYAFLREKSNGRGGVEDPGVWTILENADEYLKWSHQLVR